MNEEFITVLSEMAEGQKEGNISIGLLTKAVEGFADRLMEIEQKATNQNPPEIDTKPITDLLQVHFDATRQLIKSQPKNVTHTKQVQLFPVESFKQDFYLRMTGLILKWSVILTAALVVIYKGYMLLQ